MANKILSFFILFSFLFPSLQAADKKSAMEKKAKIIVTVDKKRVAFKFVPPEGTKLNFDGPWLLELTPSTLFKQGSPLSYSLKDFNRKDQSFYIPVTGHIGSGVLGQYKATYFVCAKDNSWCKREQVQGMVRN
jgi:hypothetical protein